MHSFSLKLEHWQLANLINLLYNISQQDFADNDKKAHQAILFDFYKVQSRRFEPGRRKPYSVKFNEAQARTLLAFLRSGSIIPQDVTMFALMTSLEMTFGPVLD